MFFSLRTSCIGTAALLAAAFPIGAHSKSPEETIPPAQTAKQTAPVSQLDGITVHGQLQALDWHTGSSTLNHHDLQQRSITNWTDFSKRGEPGVNFNRQNKSVNVRGMDADRVVTRLDGVPLPWLSDGARGVQGGLNAVSFNSLASLTFAGNAQAIRSGAITGALDLNTVSPSH